MIRTVRAVLAGLGTQLVVSAVFELLVVAIYPVLVPPSVRLGFSTRLLWESVGEVAAGAVVVRLGGIRGAIGYVAVQLAVLLLALPVRLFACSRAGSCDDVALRLVMDRWPLWLAFTLGIVLARIVASPSRRSNQALCAAGMLSLGVTLGTALNALWLVYRPSNLSGSDLLTYLSLGAPYWLGVIAGGALAGRLLARSPIAAVVLLGAVLIGPAFALGVPQLRLQGPLPTPPFATPFWLSLWSWAWVPIVASLAIAAAREIALRSRVADRPELA